MAAPSFLILNTANKITSLIESGDIPINAVLKNSTLAKRLEVSRTTINAAIQLLISNGIAKVESAQKIVTRLPCPEDYFDISNKPSCKEEVIESYFLGLINDGNLLPGDKFSELELSTASGCNTISVREFLIKFSRFGLIEKSPRAKWQMVKFDKKFAEDLIDFRRILEMNSITQLLMKPSDDKVWLELSDLLDQHRAVLADVENRFAEFSELDRQLHLIIQEASNNRFFMQFFNVVSIICHYHYQWDKYDEFERNVVALEEHIDILTHLLAHNTSGVINAMEVHLNTAKQSLLASAKGLANTVAKSSEKVYTNRLAA